VNGLFELELDILSEKSIFWKNSENLPPGRQNYGSNEDSFSLMAMKNALSELEQKNYRSERENEQDKMAIKQLEALNTQYMEKLAISAYLIGIRREAYWIK